MSIRTDREKNHKAVLEGRYIKIKLEENARDVDAEIKKRMGSFSSSFWSNRSFSVVDNKLTYTHKKQHRFVDMKNRKGKSGIKRKKRHTIHNRPIYGHLNNLIRELHFGFTDAVKAEIGQLNNTSI